MGIPRLCKKCKYGALFKGDTEYKANAFCCHPSEIKNGYGNL